MNMSAKAIQALSIITLLSNTLYAKELSYQDIASVQDQLARCDQRVTYFKPHGKYPYLMTFNPAANQLDYVLCGCYDKKINDIRLVKSPSDFVTMTPVRFVQKILDHGVQIDKKYRGHRESSIGMFLEDFFKFFRLMPDESYQGTFLVDEYKTGAPHKWALRDYKDFVGLVAYLKIKFAEAKITPINKPLLLLEFDDNTALSQLTDEDIAFLNTYFILLDPHNSIVKEFYKTCQIAINDAIRDSANAKNVLESFGEMFMRQFESKNSDFKVKDLAVKATVFVASTLTVLLLIDLAKDWFVDPVKKSMRSKADLALTAVSSTIQSTLSLAPRISA